MKKHNQITLEQRYQISALLKAKINITQIALIIGGHRSKFYRKLTRNTPPEVEQRISAAACAK